MGLEHSGPLSVEGQAELPQIENGYNTLRRFAFDLHYPDEVQVHVELSESANGIRFEGEQGRIFVNRGRLTAARSKSSPRPLPPGSVQLGPAKSHWGPDTYAHLRHFLDCIHEGVAPRLPTSRASIARRASVTWPTLPCARGNCTGTPNEKRFFPTPRPTPCSAGRAERIRIACMKRRGNGGRRFVEAESTDIGCLSDAILSGLFGPRPGRRRSLDLKRFRVA